MGEGYRLKAARDKAEFILQDYGIESLPVDPFEIAEVNDIIVKPKPDTVEGVSGMLLRHGDAFGIFYATHVFNKRFQRFSVAHELGHYFLDGHIDHILPKDGFHQSRAGFVSSDRYELEADSFAAGMLMPSGLFKRSLGKADIGLAAVEFLSNLCETSLTSTAIRYAEFVDEAVAVIISTGHTINYCFMSDTIKALPNLTWIRKGTPVPDSTATARLNSDANAVLKGARTEEESNLMDWLGGSQSIIVTEEVVGLGRYGKTLTILSSEEVEVDDESEEEEAALIESWTPRFRK